MNKKQTLLAIVLILTAKWWVPAVLLFGWAILLMLWFLVVSMFS